MTRFAGLVALTLALTASRAAAQVISGRVLDSASTRPLEGVLVILLDSAGNARAHDLTDAQGVYRVTGTPGNYRLRTLRIGFRPFTSPVARLNPGENVRRDVVVALRAVQLDTVRIAGRNPCRVRPDGPTGEVWEQARGAIAAAQVTARAKGFDATNLTFERVMTPDLHDARSRSARLTSGHTLRPWVTMSLDSIEKLGYVFRRADGAYVYYAPDLELLLSDYFVASHCFRMARESDGTRIGLAFEPTRERVVPEVAGTIWLDAATAQLRELEFKYVNIDPEMSRAGAGGDVTFARFRNGGWSISDWNIRMPIVERTMKPSVRMGSIAPGGSGVETRTNGVRVSGGELVVATRGADTLWSGNRRRLSGTVTDSSTGKALRFANVMLAGKPAVIADGSGRFAIADVLPGTYELTVIDAQGNTTKRTITFVEPEQPVALRIPPPAPQRVAWKLDTTTVSAPAVDVPGAITEFETRRARGAGRFLTADQLRELDSRPFTDVLRTKFPDLALQVTEQGETRVYNRRQQPPKALLTGGTYCFVQVVTDGVKTYGMGAAENDPPDFTPLLTRNFDAVEYYASVATTPPEYRNPGATCGTLILWSRRQ